MSHHAPDHHPHPTSGSEYVAALPAGLPQGKTLCPCTVAMDPAYYQYLLAYTGETDLQKQLYKEGETLDRPVMMASRDEYQFLAWLCATIGAKKIIEVGVFRGVTTLALALKLPADGRVRALDVSDEFAEIGKKAWAAAGVADKIDFMVGPAKDSLQKIIDEENGAGTYDFIFLDANKDEYPTYYEQSLTLLRPGGVIAMDNTLMHGRVPEEAKTKAGSQLKTLVDLNDVVRADKRVEAVMSTIADGVYFIRKL